jgi:hypothetical protein
MPRRKRNTRRIGSRDASPEKQSDKATDNDPHTTLVLAGTPETPKAKRARLETSNEEEEE